MVFYSSSLNIVQLSSIQWCIILIHYSLVLLFYTSRKHQKTFRLNYLNRVFFKLLKFLIISSYWLCSIKEICICYVLAQIPYLGKFLFLRYSPKCSQPIRLQNTLILPPEQINKIAWFFACRYKFIWIKCWSKIFWIGMIKNGCGQSGHGTLKLTVS